MKTMIRLGLLLCLATPALSGITAETSAFTNSLGLRFVSVPKLTNMMFCIWLTRVQDFRAFVNDRTNNGGYEYTNGTTPWIVTSNDSTHATFAYGWNNPGFASATTAPWFA